MSYLLYVFFIIFSFDMIFLNFICIESDEFKNNSIKHKRCSNYH